MPELERLARHVVVFDPDFVIRAVSDDYAAELGYTRRQLIGRPGSEITQTEPSRRARLQRLLLRSGVLSDVVVLQRRNGRHIGLAYTSRRVGDELYVAAGDLVPVPDGSLEAMALEPPPVTGDGDHWLTTREAAAYTRRSEATVLRAARRGELEAGGTPGRRAFRRLWLDAWLTR